MKPLTQKQSNVLKFIMDEISASARPPTVREIATHFRIASTFGVRRHLDALVKKGYIERASHTSRGITLSQELRDVSGIPIVGRVAAGAPITAIENLDGYLSLDGIYRDPDSLFCLRVRGDSMIDAGILDGDYVIVREKRNFETGEIGVAVVDEEATVKKLRRVGRFIELMPANDAYETMRVDLSCHDFRYGGKVIGLHRAL